MEKLLAQHLLEIEAVKLSPSKPFQWASGILSPIYCDNRVTLSHPATRDVVKKGLAELVDSFGEFDAVAGVATAGIPHGALLADAIGKPFIYVRSKRKAHGRQNLIEGAMKPGAKVVIVEDLISTGGSCIKAINGVREEGGEVVGALALFTYGFQQAVDAFAEINCPFKTISNYPVLLEVAVEKGFINADEKKLLDIWKQDPKGWVNRI